MRRKFFYLLSFWMFCFFAQGEKVEEPIKNKKKNPIQILHANTLSADEKLPDAQVFSGDVLFAMEDTQMSTDLAHFYPKENALYAFGNVRIFQGDSLNITSDSLYYNGKNSLAKLRGKIVMRKNLTTLYTDSLDYEVKTSIASYAQKGKIVSEQDKNTIESIKGTYYSNEALFLFEDSVTVTNETYFIRSEKLRYNTDKKTAYFIVPTVITSDSNQIFTSEGYYNTEKEYAKLSKDNILFSGGSKMVGDFLFYSRNDRVGEAFGNVVLSDSVKKVDLYGHQGVFYEKTGKSVFIKSPYVKLLSKEGDSIYLKADTLYTQKDSIFEENISKEKMQVRAYYKAKLYGAQIQAVADSLIYREKDSSMLLYKDPFLWASAKNSQVNGDSILILLNSSQELKQMDVFSPAPLSLSKPFDPEEVSEEYNQVLSQHITAYFREQNKPEKIVYKGPIQSIFYLGEEKQNPDGTSSWEKSGMNQTNCAGDMVVGFGFGGDVERISYLKNPRSVVYPMDQIPEKERFLKGFIWKIDQKPKSYQELSADFLAQKNNQKMPSKEDFLAIETANILRTELNLPLLKTVLPKKLEKEKIQNKKNKK